MIEQQSRLDIRKCSDEGVSRLVSAILMQAIRDFNIAANNINKNGRKDKDIYDIKQIIGFIQSDYFVSLTNANCPQKECIDALLTKITNKQVKEELMNYVLINEQKWINTNLIKKENNLLAK